VGTLQIDGARVRAIEVGPADGELIVCIHGVGGWAENWLPALERFGAAGFRAVAVDLPGFGESDRSRGDYFRGDAPVYARVVADVLDALGSARAHVMGHSLGGAVAYMGTVSSPGRVRTLTLVAPGGLGLDLPWRLRLGSLPLAGRLLRGHTREAARAGLASCFRDPRRIPPALLSECDRYSDVSIPETLRVLRAGLTLRGVRRDLRAGWASRAAAYGGPVLVVWGEDDAVLPVRHAAGARELFADAELRTIPDAGHLVMVEQPDAFSATVLRWLAVGSTE
jgi:pimeloyl-ACP methyl ester carboxylesterase